MWTYSNLECLIRPMIQEELDQRLRAMLIPSTQNGPSKSSKGGRYYSPPTISKTVSSSVLIRLIPKADMKKELEIGPMQDDLCTLDRCAICISFLLLHNKLPQT